MTLKKKIDTSESALAYIEEISIGVISGSPTIKPLEPNSYSDFGGQITTKARNPINANRQRKKGNVVDLEASGGFNTDMTPENLKDILQGFMFADGRNKTEFGGAGEVTGVTTSTYTAASGLDTFNAGDLVLAEGFTNAANNGLKSVSSAAAGVLTVDQTLVVETPAATATLTYVGVEGAATDLDITNSGTEYPTLDSAALDFTTLGLIVGEWIRIGGDTTASEFATAANNGFARIRSITATALTFDKTENTMVTETGTGLEVQLFFGDVLKNELAADIVRRTYTLERQLGAPDDAAPTDIQSELLKGSIPNELTFNFGTADLVTADLTFLSTDHETRDATTGILSGTREALIEADAFNTTSNVVRSNLSLVSTTNAAPTPLFAFAEEFSINVNNNASLDKAIGTLGAFEATAGTFQVGGSLTVYFADVAAVDAVRSNSDVTFDVHQVIDNKGVSFDMPLIGLGDARVNAEIDQSLKLPITKEAYSGVAIDSDLDYTLLMMFWNYLPDAASAE